MEIYFRNKDKSYNQVAFAHLTRKIDEGTHKKFYDLTDEDVEDIK